ncbi:glycoside hydrolase family 3 [candidate division KSB1 bacterium]|nr:glycoside hydrolase family 3 [candidate division KSB1 bacterium]
MSYSIDFKIGQMILVGFRGISVNSASPIVRAIRDFHIGGVWLVDEEGPMRDTIGNVKSAEQVKTLIGDLQGAAEIPLFITIDAEGGEIIRLKEVYGFPPTYPAQYLGEKDDLEFTYHESSKIARRLKNLGFNVNFSPVVDLNRNPENPALTKKKRCFSDDPQIVQLHAQQVIAAHHEAGIKCCLKHFPGQGSASDDTHLGFTDISDTWRDDEILPFQYLIGSDLADMILMAHVFNKRFDDKYPATLSKKIVTGVLREQLGYDGVVITDDINMRAIRNHYSCEQAIELALNAGVDIIVHANNANYDENMPQCIFQVIRKLVNEKRVSEDRIEEAFQRIMRVKREFR